MFFKLVVVLLLLAAILSLASGLVFLIRDRGQTDRTVKSLTLRIGLSIALFVLLFVGLATGLIRPHGINPGNETGKTLPAQRPSMETPADYSQ
jgi:ABC-type dipeptide/oligopeptide/nickel transport system permease component